MKRKIKINKVARIAYIPKDLIEEGLHGDLDGYANAVTLTIVKPDADLNEVEKSLQIVLDDIHFRQELEAKKKRQEEEESQETAEPTPEEAHNDGSKSNDKTEE